MGEKACRECHQQASEAWSGSHHDLAMQPVNPTTVLGDFKNVSFKYNNLETLFYQNEDNYYVKTDGPDGERSDYKISYVFGVYPLQQYLIELDHGRIQAFNIAWDNRDLSIGGQRWFHLYPNDRVTHSDPLHWTAPSHNWNNMCASCHSTNLKKNFDPQLQQFNTSYSQIDVSCEACHGPGSEHILWANQKSEPEIENSGLMVNLENSTKWLFKDQQSVAYLANPTNDGSEIKICARCHSRRSELGSHHKHGDALFNSHLPSLLETHLYFPDGQVKGEVYVYGSFLQSKMYKRGVTCSNCHDPHSLKLKAQGNALCSQCHAPHIFDNSDHHFHEMNTQASQCVSCHMTQKKFMVIDERADHSFRIPRPDLTVKTGSPNACTLCHDDQNPQWALRNLEKWYEKNSSHSNPLHYGVVFHAADKGAVNAEKWLNDLAQDSGESAIVRATAISRIASSLNPILQPTLLRALRDEDPLIKVASIAALEHLPVTELRKIANQNLSDELRIIRMETARTLVGRQFLLDEKTRLLFESALKEYEVSLIDNSDRAESHVELGDLYLRIDHVQKAEQAYLKAIQVNPHYIPAYINLADLYRSTNNEIMGEKIINQGLGRFPQEATLHHAKGLLKVRQNFIYSALNSLKQAVNLDPGNIRYKYVYALGLYSIGKVELALSVLESAYLDRPSNQQVLSSLIQIYSELGNEKNARFYVQKLFELSPENTNLRTFLKLQQ